ncbi:MAG: OmpA family protein, partial [Elusimicrobiota bacterium]
SLTDNFSDILLSMEAGQSGRDPMYYAVGLEEWSGKMLGLRVGYKYIADERTRTALDLLAPWRAGVSFRFSTLQLDYAYQPFSMMGDAHRLSLSWRPGGWTTKYKQVPMELTVSPRIFSPNNKGATDSVSFVPAVKVIKNIREWALTIRDRSNTPVKIFSGKGRLPAMLTWEGQTTEGSYVGEGQYYAQFSVDGDGRKQAVSDVVEIVADLTPPAVSLQVSNETLSPGGEGLHEGTTFYISATDLNGIDAWVLQINNARGKPVKIFKSSSDKPAAIYWDGTDDYYNAVVPNAVYTALLSATDKAGNYSTALVMCTVSVAPIVKEVVKEVKVTETKKGLVINLSSQVLFDAGKSALKSEGSKALNEVVAILQAYPDNQVLIEGYSDATGNRKKNIEISQARADNVTNYFVKQGVASSRLTSRGFGADQPIASNATAAGRAQNRRVEITIIKQP